MDATTAPTQTDLRKQHVIDPEICIRCNTCEETCPVKAITHDSRNYVVKAEVCNDCRAWLGAPVHAAALWPSSSVRVVKGADNLGLYKRTENSHRQFCKSCGAPVLVGHPGMGMTDIPASTVAGLAYQPTVHVHYASKVLAVRDGLPKFKDFPKEFGGSGEVLPE